MRATAARLREEDSAKWANAKVGEALGVSEDCGRKWFMHNRNCPDVRKPDARTKPTVAG